MFDTRLTPRDAYRFARGKQVKIAPLDDQESGEPSLSGSIGPLDFAAVTDHSEALGGVRSCTDPKHPPYDSQICRDYRQPAGTRKRRRDRRARSLRA